MRGRVEIGMRLAFGEGRVEKRAEGVEGGEGTAVGQEGCAGDQGFDGESADMVVEPRAPGEVYLRAGLEKGCHAARGPAAHDTGMAAVGCGEHLDDRGAFAVRPHGEDRALVPPFHEAEYGRERPDTSGRRVAEAGKPGQPAGHESRQ